MRKDTDTETIRAEDAAERVARVGKRQCGVLVVESDPDFQWRLARMLTVRGNRVVGTSSGEGALALLAQWPVDLVLVREDLPGMDGLELARRIRDEAEDVPVVLMTSDETEEVRVAARLAGAIAFLAKPFRIEALTQLLDSLEPFGASSAVPAE